MSSYPFCDQFSLLTISQRTYTEVPRHLKDDNVIPSVSEIPTFLSNIRHPRRRAVSIGPQSEADAYETLAYREKRRRDSVNSPRPATLSPNGYFDGNSSGADTPSLEGAKPSRLDVYEGMMGTGFQSESVSPVAVAPRSPLEGNPEDVTRTIEEKELFARLQQPRVRYDVEVVTKLIVYSGKCRLL